MKRLTRRLTLAFVAAVALVPIAAPAASPYAAAQAAPQASQAPLDRYFGRLGMSPLGIVNAIKLVNFRTETGQVDALAALDGMSLVEDAVKDWETQYPGDIWLPRVVMSIERIYRKIDDDRARAAALRTDAWMTTKYPESEEARALVATLDDPVPPILRP